MLTERRTRLLLPVVMIAPLLLVLLAVRLITPPQNESTPLHIDPGLAQRFSAGQARNVEVTGNPLPADLRASLTRDNGNRSAIIGWLELPGDIRRLVLNGEIGYLASGRGGLQVLDLADLSQPKVIDSVASEGVAWDIVVHDKLIYMSAGGLQVIDASRPRNLQTLSTLYLPETSLLDLARYGNTLYAGSSKGLQIFDISLPAKPRHIGALPYAGGPWALAVKEHRLLLTMRDQEHEHFVILDISKPQAPREIRRFVLPQKAWDIALHGDYAYLPLGKSGIDIYKFTNDSTTNLYHDNSDIYADFISFEGDLAYFASRQGDFNIFQIETPVRFRHIGAVALPPQPRPVVVRDQIAFVANGHSGLLVIDNRSPRRLESPLHFDTPHNIGDMLRHNDHLFLANNSGLHIAKHNHRDNTISMVSRMSTPLGFRVMARSGNLLCAAGSNSPQAELIDVGDPKSPVAVGTITGRDSLQDIAASDRYFFLAEANRVVVVDASNPSSPQTISSIDISNPKHLQARENRLYVTADDEDFLTVIALDHPDGPTIVGKLSLPWPLFETIKVRDSTLAEDWLVLSTGASGLLVVDVSTDTPKTLSGINLGEQSVAVNYQDGYLYTITNSGDFWVLRRDEEGFVRVAATRAMLRASSLLIDGRIALVTSQTRGLSVVPIPQAMKTRVEKQGRRMSLELPPEISPGDYRIDLIYNNRFRPYAPIRIEAAPPADGVQ